MSKIRGWSRLDNAAKIFPTTGGPRDTKVFRFTCELKEEVDPAFLQPALEETLEEFPIFRSVLKKGLFWHYFEETTLMPRAEPENLPVCAPIYNPDNPDLLFRVTYFGRRINTEVFHALSDGTGVLNFMRALVYRYLKKKHGFSGRLADFDAARDERNADAFDLWYEKEEHPPITRKVRPYRFKGERLPFDRIGITEGLMPASAVLALAKAENVTLSEYLVSVLVACVHETMPVRDRRKPVTVAVPVNLRRFFPASTVRNFFGVVRVTHDFSKDGTEFADILQNVRREFRTLVTEENMRRIMAGYSALERHLLIKPVPLMLKIPVLRLAARRTETGETVAFSNVGKVTMPAEAAEHIQLFDFYISTKRPQICLCTFDDNLALSFSSPFVDTGLQRRFFRHLTQNGVPVKIFSNMEPCPPAALPADSDQSPAEGACDAAAEPGKGEASGVSELT